GIWLEQGAGTRQGNRLGAAGGSQFAEQVADVFFDGGQLDHQGLGDVLIGGPGGQQAQDFLLTPGQGGTRRGEDSRCLLRRGKSRLRSGCRQGCACALPLLLENGQQL